MAIHLIPALSDNDRYLLEWDGMAAVIDPASAEPVEEKLSALGLSLKLILATHHHADHIDGVNALKVDHACLVLGPDDERIPDLDRKLKAGTNIEVGPWKAEVLGAPGHTKTQLAFYFPELKALFCGDSLFAGGCGRLFEGTAEDMWETLSRFMELPDDTKVYCGHEYTEDNLLFALTVDGGNEKLKKRLEQVQTLRQKSKPTIPSTIGEEKATNPFLRVREVDIRKNLGLEDASDVDVFAEIRNLKDSF